MCTSAAVSLLTQLLILLFAFLLLVVIWHIVLLPLLLTFLHVIILLVPLKPAVVNALLLLVPLLVDLEPVTEVWRPRTALGLPHI